MSPQSSLVVLDSSVVSLLARGGDTASYYEDEIEGLRPVISFQTREEALFGAIKAGWGQERMSVLRAHLDQYDVVAGSLELVEVSANLRSERERAGRPLQTADAWIAATAMLLHCPLATHDRDFADIPNLQLIQAPKT
ncbi:MAG: PIN domain-containing protein [Chloroflexi bacterium]|nr:PIN domain-containing protein [Chloroflexota bacterium]